MKNILYKFSFLLSLILLFSCEPSRAENGDFLNGIDNSGSGGNGGGESTATKLLKKVTIDDEGDVIVYTYNYDNEKRLISVNTSDNSSSTVISYLENNINKIIYTTNVSGEINKETILPTYNNGKITKITKTHVEANGSLQSVADLTYHSNGWPATIKEKIYNQDNTGVVGNVNSDFTYAGNNITQWHAKATVDFTLPVPVFDFLKELELTVNLSNYDNKINPFKSLPKDYLIAISHSDFETGNISGFGQNNATKMHAIFTFAGGSGEDTQQVAYTYDKDGYPLTAASMYVKTKFEYQ